MSHRAFAVILSALLCASFALPAAAAPTAIAISIPLTFGHRAPASLPPAAGAERAERRLRLARYGLQLADAIISAIGYRAYARCLSCLAYPGGGPRGSAPLSVAGVNGNQPAEIDPLIQPFSRGGLLTLILGTVAYDVADARIERHWSPGRRTAADVAEIGGHIWGISTWLPELRNIHRATAIAAACGAQWRARQYGQAFSDGCVNEYYRPGPAPAAPLAAAGVDYVCAPAQFKSGTYLFATQNAYIVADGTPCPPAGSPFH